MNINLDNYETFLIDYMEGTLNPSDKKQVEAFLMLHPQIQEEFRGLQSSFEAITSEAFDNKDALKKIPFEQCKPEDESFDFWCIDRLENNMTPSSTKLFDEVLNTDAHKKKAYELFQKTILAEPTLSFNESLLIKKPGAVHEVNPENFEQYAIACHEGWLEHSAMLALNKFIGKHPEYKKEYDLYGKLKFKADKQLQFPNKNTLKKFRILANKNKRIALYVAAAIMALLINFWYLNTQEDAKNKQFSTTAIQKEEPIIVEESKPSLPTEEITPVESAIDSIIKKEYKPTPFFTTSADVKTKEFKANLLKPIKPKHISTHLHASIKTPQLLPIIKKQYSTNKISPTSPNNAAKKIDLWELTQAGIRGINKATQSNMRLEKKTQGNKTSIEFNSKVISFSTKAKKRKNI